MKTEDGQSVAGRIQNLLSDIKNDITSCGNVINKYHQHSTAGERSSIIRRSACITRTILYTAKFFLSGQYKDQFKAQADKLVVRLLDQLWVYVR